MFLFHEIFNTKSSEAVIRRFLSMKNCGRILLEYYLLKHSCNTRQDRLGLAG